MSQANIKICKFVGDKMKTYIPAIAKLRVEVFHDYPYLYESSTHAEADYLKKFANCKDAVLIIVFDRSEIVGVSAGIPLENEPDEIKQTFLDHQFDTATCYYFSESMLLKKYRGRGLGHHFYDEREAHVRKLGRYTHISIGDISRPGDHPLKPDDYISPDDFWKKRGYVKHQELACPMSWPDIGEEQSSVKPMIFWVKTL